MTFFRITISVTGRRRYALILDSAGFAAPVHPFYYKAPYRFWYAHSIQSTNLCGSHAPTLSDGMPAGTLPFVPFRRIPSSPIFWRALSAISHWTQSLLQARFQFTVELICGSNRGALRPTFSDRNRSVSLVLANKSIEMCLGFENWSFRQEL